MVTERFVEQPAVAQETTLKNLLRETCRSRHISKAEIARQAGLSDKTLRNIELGKSISPKTAKQLTETLFRLNEDLELHDPTLTLTLPSLEVIASDLSFAKRTSFTLKLLLAINGYEQEEYTLVEELLKSALNELQSKQG